MLNEMTREEWLSTLGLTPEWCPQALWLRGTRNLGGQAAVHRKHFEEIAPLQIPNGLFEDVVIGKIAGQPVAYASVYGAPMAADLVHLAGVLGARLVLLSGCCGSLRKEFTIGDLVVATEAECGEGASQRYLPGATKLKARIYGRDMGPLGGGKLHFGTVHSTSCLLGETRDFLTGLADQGCWGVDLEAATVYAVAERFGMDRVAVLYAYDRPLGPQHLLTQDADTRQQRALGDVTVTALVLRILKDYLNTPVGANS